MLKTFSSVLVLLFVFGIQGQAKAKTMSEIEIGQILCYDRLGPVDSIGAVVEKNYDRGAVTIEYRNIFKKLVRKSFPIGKIKDPLYCKAKGAAQRALLKKLIDSTASE